MNQEGSESTQIDERALALIGKFIQDQQIIIRRCGLKPTWEVFTGSVTWLQIREQLTKDARIFLREAWCAVLSRDEGGSTSHPVV